MKTDALLVLAAVALLAGAGFFMGAAGNARVRRSHVAAAVYQPKTVLDGYERGALSFQAAARKDGAEDVEHCVSMCLCRHRGRGCEPLGLDPADFR